MKLPFAGGAQTAPHHRKKTEPGPLHFRELPRRKRRAVALVCLTTCLCGILAAAVIQRRAAAVSGGTENWGLSFPKEGDPPVGPVSAEQLAEYDGLYLADPAKPILYLTFDAGFENGNTAAILDALKAHKAPAVFFLVGNYIATQPDLVRRMVAEGHTVGNHTNTHPDMSRILDRAAFEKELKGLEALYEETMGAPMKKLYRPPQGKYNRSNLKMAQDMGYKTVFWSLAYVDWYTDNQPTRQQALEKLLPRIHNGAILLLHATSSTNAAILDELLTSYEEMGYSFGDLAALLFPEG
ncbi:MAG: polysaccharide deacetylase family protein [Clostridia bacterium]|nr:polysaccharide deacetylase family protein [Clostridia bacterium]